MSQRFQPTAPGRKPRVLPIGLEPTGRPESPESSGWRPPPEIDGYRLNRQLGRGGMGEVWLAHDTLLDRPVAVKFIIAMGDPQARERFFLEARAIARLQHPNVVTIYRVGEFRGQPYLVSEFIRGESLDQLERPIPWERAVELGMGIARGLTMAHQRGVLHRDIKPANAILSEDGEVKLLDFGLAKLVDEMNDVAAGGRPTAAGPLTGIEPTGYFTAPARSQRDLFLTSPGVVMGTPHYMAPEIWRAEPATYRSDVYAFGALLYFLTADRPPYEAEDLNELAARVEKETPPPLASLVAGIDPRFAAVVDRCLARDPEARFANANEVRAALAQLSPEGRVGAAIPEGNPYRGLHSFEAEHRGLYFGRDTEIRTILERLHNQSFVVVAGDSGVGKSSLCRAGIVPRAGEGALGAGRTWQAVTVVPGRHPVAALAAGLAPYLKLPEEEVAQRMVTEPGAIGREIRRHQGTSSGVLIFIDQLEELVTLADPMEAVTIAELLSWLTTPTPGVRVLATVRGDFLVRLAALPGIAEEVTRAIYFLRPLSSDRIREAIVGPASATGVRFESEDLVDVLVKSTEDAEGGLPLLQFALAVLWEARDPARKMITMQALDALGGVAGALGRHADQLVDSLGRPQRSAAQRILTSLVTSQGTRARRGESELIGTETAGHDALHALVQGRLLVAREAPGGSAYELAHEALISGWTTLRGWLSEHSDRRVAKERLEVAVTEWLRLGRAPEALWSARQLEEVRPLARNDLNKNEREFLDRSRRSLRRKRLLRGLAIAGVPLLASAVYVGFWAKQHYQQDRQIQEHLSQAKSELILTSDAIKTLGRLREEAFARFDRGESQAGETQWSRALSLGTTVEASFGRASHELENALMIDGSRPEVRGWFGGLLFERAIWSDQAHNSAQRDELLQRLVLYDADGGLLAKWQEPGTLSILSTPVAEVTLSHVVVDSEHRRVAAAPRSLGKTPIAALQIEPGSYLLSFTAAGRAPVRYPVLVARGEALRLEVPLPAAAAVPEGYVYISPGRFLFGSTAEEGLRRNFFNTVPIHPVRTEGYIIARYETTFADWLQFLSALSAADRLRHLPRSGNGGFQGALEIKELSGGATEFGFQPAGRRYGARSGEPIVYAARPRRAEQDWRRFPVFGIAWADAVAYVEWLDRSGRLPGARICTELEWERAARGADDRAYPHGDALLPEDADYDDTYQKAPLAIGPDEVGSHPTSCSPFGVDDMVGNVWEWTRSYRSHDEYVARGGSYYFDQNSARSTNRQVSEPTLRDLTLGMRVCASR